MLTGLSIRDVVLIDRLDLAFHSGLCVLTGETGAGKSILLDALGLALGGRSEATLIRSGADQAVVTASFDAPADHPVRTLLADQGLDGEDAILVRRVVNRDGRSRAFINDQPTSVGMLRQAGDLLVPESAVGGHPGEGAVARQEQQALHRVDEAEAAQAAGAGRQGQCAAGRRPGKECAAGNCRRQARHLNSSS